MKEIKLDSKGRILIPENVRRKVGFRRGSKLKVRTDRESVIITKGVEPKEFIEEIEGFLREGSPVQATDPLKLKKIWVER